MRHATLNLAAILCCLWSFAICAEEVIPVSDAAAIKASLGKQAVVEGVIASARWSASGKVMNIRFKDTAESKFVAAILEKDRKVFDQAFEGNAPRAIEGAKVRIRGLIREFRANPEMVLKEPGQLTIIEKAKTGEDKKPEDKPNDEKK